MAYPAAAEAIDREKVCPCLLRVFYRVGNTLRCAFFTLSCIGACFAVCTYAAEPC